MVLPGSGSSTPSNVSPQSDSSSNLPSSSDLTPVVVKKEVLDEQTVDNKASYKEHARSKECAENSDNVQDMPEDLSAGSSNGSTSSG